MPKQPGRGRQGDDEGPWVHSGYGGDPDAPERMPGAQPETGMVTAIGDAFWRAMGAVTVSIPRWASRPRMNANIKYMLRNHTKTEIEESFVFFAADIDNLQLVPSCWDVYFRRRGRYLRLAQRAAEGRRPGEVVHKAGDIRVDNERFHVHSPGDVPTDTAINNPTAEELADPDEE